ncbi:DUF421 domain-containing protein [Pararcticibacter amylolyticus]|uniref:DUF421 domain-containing protein n=1 Tax=Pararcticibacter amylolyticus TaxID=2173175 RepID=A0A2U2PGU9_9SPHI|nr:DUF421 domain-containing protein [Pararcticibacter amylolyticus]PWG80590.1 DUF421 domain-containing protein [Pararcticibacter amylolyticus]
MEKIFDWNRIMFNDLPAAFLLEVVLRSVVMFMVILMTLRASGKRGIRQLSIFELVLIIGLGSAAGDPMFYEDVGILPALTVFLVIILLYMGITRLTDRFRWFERVMEGEPVYVVQSGKIRLEELKRTGLSREELFSELRLQNVEHLGQVRTVLIETTGEVSVLFFPDEEVKPGLPIFPGQQKKVLPTDQNRCCAECGEPYTNAASNGCCTCCGCDEWVGSMTTKRIA